jgi:hypothetical protein
MADFSTGRRRRLLCALVGLGVAVALMTETLSLVHAIRRPILIAAWSVLAAVAGGAVIRHWRTRVPRSVRPARWGIFDSLLLAGIAGIGAVTAFTAIVCPPNSVDAFGYHLARVVYWAQAGSVAFFPTHYYSQLTMPPLAEYCILHAYVLAGGDRFVNLVQWGGFMGSVMGVSLIAQALGARRRGQVLASVFCATLPNGILQASGAKNDCLLALWLVAMVFFALRFARHPNRADAIWAGAALSLALLTKGTSYVYAPALLLGSMGPGIWSAPRRALPAAAAMAASVLALNGPQWWRNFDLSGSVLGFASADETGRFRWTDDRYSVRGTFSSALRNISQQLGARSPHWNQSVYQAVLWADRALGIDPNDPANTWPETTFEAPVNSNHEADAPNRWHFLLLAIAAIPLVVMAWRGRERRWLAYYAGLVLAFVLFCAVLKYQPYLSRMFLPLFILGAPVFGVLAERIRPAVVQAALCLLLFDQVRHPLFGNWTRPLRGPASILHTSRDGDYFRDMRQFGVGLPEYDHAANMVAASACNLVGIDNGPFQLEYPFAVLLLERNPKARFVHVGVTNATAKYAPAPAPQPCAVLCLGCAGRQEKLAQYRGLGEPLQAGALLVYLKPAALNWHLVKRHALRLASYRLGSVSPRSDGSIRAGQRRRGRESLEFRHGRARAQSARISAQLEREIARRLECSHGGSRPLRNYRPAARQLHAGGGPRRLRPAERPR